MILTPVQTLVMQLLTESTSPMRLQKYLLNCYLNHEKLHLKDVTLTGSLTSNEPPKVEFGDKLKRCKVSEITATTMHTHEISEDLSVMEIFLQVSDDDTLLFKFL